MTLSYFELYTVDIKNSTILLPYLPVNLFKQSYTNLLKVINI